MENSGRAEVWAGIGMLVVCLLVGGVEGASVLAAASVPYFLGWLVAFVVFLVGLLNAATVSTPTTLLRHALVIATPVLAASAVVLLSPNRGGMGLLLLVLGAAICAYHLGPQAIVAVIAWNSVVVAAATSALGPLVTEPNPAGEMLVATLLYALLQAGTATMVWSHQRVTEALQDVTIAHVELRGTSALLEESSQARERLRISRELHDVLGHQLTVLSVELEVASHQAEGPSREHVLRARALAKTLLADVRSVVGTERHRRFDLPAALARVTGEIPHPRVHLDVDPDLPVDHDRAAIVVRAVQEISTNTIRHARADNLWISVTADDDMLRLDARDDGRGVALVVPGHGLNGLRERVEALHGRLELDGTSGFRITAELPARHEVPA